MRRHSLLRALTVLDTESMAKALVSLLERSVFNAAMMHHHGRREFRRDGDACGGEVDGSLAG